MVAALDVAGFAITVPSSWYELDLSPATRNASINELIQDRVRDVPELGEHRQALTKLLRRMAREAHANGAVYCAMMCEPVDGAGLTASVTVSTTSGPVDRHASDGQGAEVIAAALTVREAQHADDTWQHACTVDVPGAALAARAYGVDDVELPENGGWVRSVVMQTLVPVPGDDRVAIISCSSPNLTLAAEMHDLFDAISSTFQFLVDGQDTVQGPTRPT